MVNEPQHPVFNRNNEFFYDLPDFVKKMATSLYAGYQSLAVEKRAKKAFRQICSVPPMLSKDQHLQGRQDQLKDLLHKLSKH